MLKLAKIEKQIMKLTLLARAAHCRFKSLSEDLMIDSSSVTRLCEH